MNGHKIFRFLLLNCHSDGKRLGSYLMVNVKVPPGSHLDLNKKSYITIKKTLNQQTLHHNQYQLPHKEMVHK